uniref:Solute carrier family 39 member 1 n=1 Tax=Oncorhynchus mykiss TaxID=8022 RepID=A0A8K9XB01_ONCMY
MALRKGSSSVALSGWSSEVQMNPADVPGLEVKLGALVVFFSITLVCGFAPLCLVRGAGRCNVHSMNYISMIKMTPTLYSRACCVSRYSHHSHGREELGGEDSHFHVDFNSTSAIRGLAVELQEDSQEVLEICVALLLHKSIISFSQALKLAQGKLRQAAVVGCLLLFALMSPLGIAVTKTKSSPQHQLARSTLEGLASGTFMYSALYITFMEILLHELSSPQNPKVAMILTGFAVVTGVLFIKM